MAPQKTKRGKTATARRARPVARQKVQRRRLTKAAQASANAKRAATIKAKKARQAQINAKRAATIEAKKRAIRRARINAKRAATIEAKKRDAKPTKTSKTKSTKRTAPTKSTAQASANATVEAKKRAARGSRPSRRRSATRRARINAKRAATIEAKQQAARLAAYLRYEAKKKREASPPPPVVPAEVELGELSAKSYPEMRLFNSAAALLGYFEGRPGVRGVLAAFPLRADQPRRESDPKRREQHRERLEAASMMLDRGVEHPNSYPRYVEELLDLLEFADDGGAWVESEVDNDSGKSE